MYKVWLSLTSLFFLCLVSITFRRNILLTVYERVSAAERSLFPSDLSLLVSGLVSSLLDATPGNFISDLCECSMRQELRDVLRQNYENLVSQIILTIQLWCELLNKGLVSGQDKDEIEVSLIKSSLRNKL